MPVSETSHWEPGNWDESSRKCQRLHPHKEERVSSWLCYNLEPSAADEELEVFIQGDIAGL